MVASTMLVAARTDHAGKGLWIFNGGAEYVLTNAAVVIGFAFAGAGDVVARPRDRLGCRRHVVGPGRRVRRRARRGSGSPSGGSAPAVPQRAEVAAR